MITGIVVALPEELCTLTAKKLVKGDICQLSDQVIVSYSGAGVVNARLAAELLINHGARSLISWGCTAGLVEKLVPGDLLLSQECIAADKSVIQNSSDWLYNVEAKLSPHVKIVHGRLAESLWLVATTLEKKAVNEVTNAIALDMESVAIAKVAKEYDLPFLIIRAIADPVGMNLPKAISVALNEQGVINLQKLLIYLFTHPAELPGLIKLGLHFNAAQKTLRLVAKQLDSLVIRPQTI